jgi:hypothetical protein
MIKFSWPSWVTGWIVFTAVLMLLVVGRLFYQPQGLPLWMDKILKSLYMFLMLAAGIGGLALNYYYHRDWLHVKQANGQLCPGCRYPGSIEVGGKCTECGMDFTPDIVERWRRWWSSDRLPIDPNRELSDKMTKEFLLRHIRKLRQTRFFPSRSKPTPTPPTPNAPPPPQPDPLASKTDA